MEIGYTNGIPICPYCKKPTVREQSGIQTTTLMYFKPIYDKEGNNINPDRNITSGGYRCCECGKTYSHDTRNI